MNYEEYYRQSRAYNYNDLAELRMAKHGLGRDNTEVPDCFKHEFADRAAYDAWVEEKRRDYFG